MTVTLNGPRYADGGRPRGTKIDDVDVPGGPDHKGTWCMG